MPFRARRADYGASSFSSPAAAAAAASSRRTPDVRDFVARWFDDPQNGETLRDSRFDELGFALFANGEGLKIALAVLADQHD